MNKDSEENVDSVVDAIDAKEEENTSSGELADEEAVQPAEGALRFGDKTAKKSRKKKLIVTGVIVALLVGLFAAVPFLRYGLVGIFVSKQVVLTIVDSSNQKPVSDAKVSLGRFDGTSDGKGKVVINGVPVGEYTLIIEKKNYETLNGTHLVPIVMSAKQTTRSLKATGRTVAITITNNISGKPVVGATVDIEGSTASSDDKGIASVVLPVKTETQQGKVSADGYNDAEVSVQMKTNDDQAVAVKLTPAGKVYFLSKRTGTINVMSANLDGSQQAVVVQGTGKEVDAETSLLPSPDWSSLILIARRDNERAKLYIVPTNSPQPKLVESGDVSYEPVGWTGGKFYYKTRNNAGNLYDNNYQQLLSYDTASGARQVVDSTVGLGTGWHDYSAQQMTATFITGGKVVYMKYWQHGAGAANKNRPFELMTINPSGNIKSVTKTIAADGDYYGDAMMRRPNSIVFRQGANNSQGNYFEYVDGKVTSITMQTTDFYVAQPAYQMSPSGEKVFWQESRDGRNVLFVADKNLAGGNQVSSGDYSAYGWVGNDYVLYSKNRSELYIAPAGVAFGGEHKVTDYHKAMGYPGYGWGAGGAS